jgi:hypothetical protein
MNALTVGLGNTLQLILLLDGIGVGGALGGVDELISEALSNGLDVAESRLTGTDGQQGDSLVDTTEGGDIDGLTTDGTGGTDTGGIFTGAGVDDGINENLDGVLVREQVDDLESVLDDTDSHQLLSVVATVHHQGVGETLNNGALGLAETLGGETTSGVGQVDGSLDLDVIDQRDILDLDIVVGPLVEEADSAIGLNAGRKSKGSHFC